MSALPWAKLAAVAAVVAILAALVLGIYHKGQTDERGAWRLKMAAQEAAAARLLAAETERARTKERELDDLKTSIERTHHEAEQKTAALLADNRRLALQLGGLRDPGSRPGGGCAAGTDPGAAGGSAGGTASAGLLSDEASEFLLTFAAEADAVNDALHACRDWALGVSGKK